jgi:hypothetical protein
MPRTIPTLLFNGVKSRNISRNFKTMGRPVFSEIIFQCATSTFSHLLQCHQTGGLNDIFLPVYYAGDPQFLWRIWLSYKLKYHCEKYENFLTSGFEHIISL